MDRFMRRHARALAALALAAGLAAPSAAGLIDGILGRKAAAGIDQTASWTEEALVAGAEKEGALLWYAGTNPMHKAVVKAFQAKYPFIEVEAVYLGGPTIAQRFYADKERGVEVADCFSSGLTEVYPDARERGYLARLDGLPRWKDHPAWAKDPNGHYAFFHSIRHVIISNVDEVSDADAPKTYAELADPRWKDRVALVDPDTGGMGVYFARFAAGNPALGFPWMERMRANGVHLSYQSGQLLEAVTSGRRAVALGRDVEAVDALKSGAPIRFVRAADGYPLQFTTIGVNRRAPHPHAARLFADWLLSAEMHAVMEKEGYGVPTADGEAELTRGAWKLDVETITPKETKEFTQKASRAFKGE
jgi:iron(III) transport system substrate-binding protein